MAPRAESPIRSRENKKNLYITPIDDIMHPHSAPSGSFFPYCFISRHHGTA